MPDRLPTDALPREMTEARNKAIEEAAYALWQASDAPRAVCIERATIAVNAAWDSLGPLFDKLLFREPRTLEDPCSKDHVWGGVSCPRCGSALPMPDDHP